jgi:hypothetical protein
MCDNVSISPERYHLLELLESGASDLFKWSEQVKSEYKGLYKIFCDTHSDGNTGFSNNDKGKALEDLVTFIFKNIKLFKYIRNHQTGDFEIDIIVKLSTLGYASKQYYQFLNYISNYLIGECKNYNDTLSITYTGKFYSLLKRYDIGLGIIFSYKGLAGQSYCSGWTDALGLTKKVYLKEKILILDFNIKYFEKLNSGENFIDILNELIDQTILDITSDFNTIDEHEDIGSLE